MSIKNFEGKKTFHISGNTFEHKTKIRKMGGRWNPSTKTWIIEVSSTSKIFNYIKKGLVIREKAPFYYGFSGAHK